MTDLNTAFPPELLGIECGAVDSVITELGGSGEERSRLGEQSIIFRLHDDRLDQHRIPSVLVWL